MRRSLLTALLFFLAIQGGQAQNRAPGEPWTCSKDNLDDSTVVCKERTQFGERRYITDVVAQSTTGTAGFMELYYGTGTNCGTGSTPILGTPGEPATRYTAAGNAAPPTILKRLNPIIVPAGKDFCVQGDAANPITIQVFGYSAP